MKSNVLNIKDERVKEATIANMVTGQIGYAVPRAFVYPNLDEDFMVLPLPDEEHTLEILCVYPHGYSIIFK